MQYQLNIVIDDAGLDYLYGSGQSVVLVRSVETRPAPPNPPKLAWVVFAPFQENRVQWDDGSYFYYAITTQGIISNSIRTDNPIQPGIVYTFTDLKITTGPGSGTAFAGVNQLSWNNPSLGLQQVALVNNLPSGSSMNAVPVPLHGTSDQTPVPLVHVFSANGYREGQAISQIPQNVLKVPMENGFATIGFDNAAKKFVLLSLQARRAEARVSA